MPEIGEIERSVNLGYVGANLYRWSACPKCGKERWLQIRHAASLCGSCSKRGNHYKGNNVTPNAGRERARVLYQLEPCHICGAGGERHHKDEDAFNNKRDNIEFLCHYHHMKTHGIFEMLQIYNRLRRAATHCARGHPFDAENTRITKEGWRRCRICIAMADKRYRQRKNG